MTNIEWLAFVIVPAGVVILVPASPGPRGI